MRKFLLLWGWLGLLSAQAIAQDGRVTGKVTAAEDATALPGATVAIRGTTRGTTADANGNFALNAAPGDVLVFSFVGTKTAERTVTAGQTVYDVALESDALRLDEVVAIGYGTARKRDLTGATTSLKTEEIVNQPVPNAAQAMQGKLAGVQVFTSGEPGATPQIRIRGTGTLLAGAEPLYVVDGVLTDDIRNINPQDIASIDVLKDASATAIYGVRAANGVVLVTTKRGSAGLRVTYDGYAGFRQAANRVNMADGAQYVAYSNEALRRAGQQPVFTSADAATNTDWFREITRNALLHNHNLSISGGGEKNTFLLSAGYLHDDGILRGNNYRRLTLRGSNEYQLTSFLKIGAILSLARETRDNKPFSAFTSAYKQAPIVPVRNADGTYGFSQRNNVANPVAQLDYTNDASAGWRTQGVVFGEWNVTKNLLFRSNYSVESQRFDGTVYSPVFQVSANQRNLVSSLNLRGTNAFRWIWDNTVTYSQIFGDKHDFKLLAGITSERIQSRFLGGTRQNVPNDPNSWYLNVGNQATATNESGGSLETRLSYYSRLNYSFNQKYLLTATLRYDGSSKFPSANRFGLFPSVGAAWRISDEAFMRDVTAISDLKLRASWGQIGNDRISPSEFLLTVTPGLDYPFGNALTPGYTPTNIKDPNLSWEKTTETNLGIEFGLLNNRLGGEIDFYDKLTRGALIFRPIDAIFGDADNAYLTNAADIRNRGIEVALRWNERRGDFRYNFGLTLTFNRNTIERVNGGLPINAGGLGNGQFTTRTAEGQPIGSFWVWRTNGIFQNEAELAASPRLGSAKVGDLRYVDENGDGLIDERDRVFVGSYQPKFFAGFTAGASYKAFDLSLTTFGNFGNKVYNGKKAQRFGNENIEASVTDWWSPETPTNRNPRPSNDVAIASDYYVESGSFFRINNLTLGYTLPKGSFGGKTNSVRFYLTSQNLLTIQKFSGFTPELPRGTLDSGIELDAYPTTRTVSAGVTVGF